MKYDYRIPDDRRSLHVMETDEGCRARSDGDFGDHGDHSMSVIHDTPNPSFMTIKTEWRQSGVNPTHESIYNVSCAAKHQL